MAKGKDEFEARKQVVSLYGKDLARRCKSLCELCGESTSLEIFEVAPVADPEYAKCAMICEVCKTQVEDPAEINVNHWHCLNETAWTEEPAVQVLIWRLLGHLKAESWAQDLKEQLYLEEEVLEWAEDDGTKKKATHFDSNNDPLFEGDSVHIIKDLDVRGASFTAKRGTAVKNIHLCTNPEHVEGRVSGTKIVLKACFLKKSN
ncbi:PhnA domain-containing protein [Lentisphaera profundi]|uniref:PhnA domain-containing protein n=1 Tax=Lentisphaera profundi TaxID=1658616 RepID=A0ABY7VV14_9BACT|nr:alkylphosphonate utilization protein [Lentisphaera profundi]WDE98060.1 PhnA domain-containing protein [Lentisphaera profundi]